MLFRICRIPIEKRSENISCLGRNRSVHGLGVYTNTRTPSLTVNHASGWQIALREPPHKTLPSNYGGYIIRYGSCRSASEILHGKDCASYQKTSQSVFNRGVRHGDRYTIANLTNTFWASNAGFRSLCTLHTQTFNSRQTDAADLKLTNKVQHPAKDHKTKAATYNTKHRSSEGRRVIKDEFRDNKSHSALNRSDVSVDRLWLTAKHTRNYADAARIVDSLLDNCDLRSKDGVAAINIYKLSRQPDKCVQTLEYIHRKGGRLHAKHYGPCIAALNTSGHYRKAEVLYEQMRARDVQSNVIVCNIMIQVHAKSGNFDKAMSLFRDMPGLGIAPTVYTYSILMSALNRTDQWERAVDLYEHMKQEGVEQNTHTCSAAITACGKGNKWFKAFEILNEMGAKGFERTIVTYNSAISACGAGHRLDKAIGVLQEMEANGIERDIITYSSMIAACQQVGDWSKALDYLEAMQKTGIIANTITYNTAIAACGAGHRLDKAIDLREEMVVKGIARDAITYTNIISACEKVGDWKKALEYFEEMAISKIGQDTITYSSVISACAEKGEWKTAMDLFNNMGRDNIRRNAITYLAAMKACVKGGEVDRAIALFDEMEVMNVDKTVECYTTAIEALGGIDGEQSRIDSLYKDMTVKFQMYRDDWSVLASSGRLDLHDHSRLMAQAAIRRLLSLLLRQYRDVLQISRLKLDCIIVGKGQNRTEESVLLNTVQTQLHGLSPPIASQTLPKNVGRLVLSDRDLKQWLQHNS